MAMSVVTPVTLRWRDFDALGHVNNSVYLSYLEVARDRLMGDLIGEAYLCMVIARIELDYREEIPLGTDQITVTCRPISLGTSSLRTEEQILLPGGGVAATAITVGVVRDEQTRSSRPWTDAEREVISRAIG